MLSSDFISYTIMCIVAAASPGPGNITVIYSAMNNGITKTYAYILGILVGLTIIAILVLQGLGLLLIQFKAAYITLHIVSVAYILYLGVICCLNARKNDTSLTLKTAQPKVLFKWHQGLAVSLFSPKGLIFFSALLPSYLHQDAPLALQYTYLILILLTSTFLVLLLYAVLAQYCAPFLLRHRRMIDLGSGLVLILMAIYLALRF